MDFTEQLADHKVSQDTENSEGAAMLNNLETQDKLEESKRQNGKFQSAFDGSDLNSKGASLEDYDYENEFNEGNSFKPDDEGGIVLSNKNIKPGTKEIAGFDAVTGERFKGQHSDEEGYIQQGMLELQGSNVNTMAGAPSEDMLSLTKIAKGIDGNYDDFLLATQGPWSDEQRAVAWDSKEQANIVMEDVDNFGARYTKPDKEEVAPYRSQGIEADIDETELVSNAVWIQSGRKFVDYFNPEGSAGMSDQEVHDFNLSTMSSFNWNLPMMMFMTNEIALSGDKELAQAFLFMMDQNDATNVSMASVGRGMGGVFGDITTYATVGGGVLISRMAAASVKAGVKKTLSKLLSVTAFEATEGGVIGAVDEISRQTVEGAAGEREELDKGKVAKTAATGAVVNTVIGGGAGVIADPTLRKFGVNTTKKAISGLGDMTTPKGSMGMAKQKGIIELGGAEKFTPSTVEFRSKLIEEIEEIDKGVKGENISTKKLKNKINLWINEGKIKQQEVDWSGLNGIEADSVSISEVRAIIGANRPVPQLNSVAQVRFESMTLSLDTSGYREYTISVDKVGGWQGPSSHFGRNSPQGEIITPRDQANVGHLRLADSIADGKQGTMLLEAQSDLRRVHQTQTTPMSKMAAEVKESKEYLAMGKANVAFAKAQSEWESLIIELGNKYGLDPQAKNYEFQVLEAVDGAERAKMDKMVTEEMKLLAAVDKTTREYSMTGSKAPFTPFRDNKSSNALMFRSAVMDAMNNNSEFLSWPKTREQVSIIEGWIVDSPHTGLRDKTEGIVKFYEKELPKIAKQHGFKVEEFVPDEFKNKTRTHKKHDTSMPEEYWENFDVWLDDNNLTISEASNEIYTVFDLHYNRVEVLHGNAELQRYANEVMLKDVTVPFENNKFWRIVFDDKAKAKWKKDGAAMYSFGAPVAVGAGMAGKKKQERDKDGKFK